MNIAVLLQIAIRSSETGRPVVDSLPMSDETVTEALRPSQIRVALDRVLLAKHPQLGLDCLQRGGLIKGLFSELEAIVGFGGEGHKALWPHTLQVVCQTIPKVHLRWAALFHDVGKVKVFSTETGKISFHNHEAVSARLFNEAAKRTGLFSDDERSTVKYLIRNLGLVEAYESNWTDNAVRRLYTEVGPHFEDLVALSRADITTANANKKAAHHERIKELVTRTETLKAQDTVPPALPTGLGESLITEFGYSRSAELGKIMKLLKDLVEKGNLPRNASHDVYLKYVREHPMV